MPLRLSRWRYAKIGLSLRAFPSCVWSAASGTPLVTKKSRPSAALLDAPSLSSLPCWVVPLCEPAAGSPPLRSLRHSVPGIPSARSLSLHSKVKPATRERAFCHPRPAIPPASARFLCAGVPSNGTSAPFHISEASGRPGLQPCTALLSSLRSGLLAQRASLRYHCGPHTAPVTSA